MQSSCQALHWEGNLFCPAGGEEALVMPIQGRSVQKSLGKVLTFSHIWNKKPQSEDHRFCVLSVGEYFCIYTHTSRTSVDSGHQTHLHLPQAAPARQRLRPSQTPTWSLVWGYVSSEKHLCAEPASPGCYCKNTLQNKLTTKEASILTFTLVSNSRYTTG